MNEVWVVNASPVIVLAKVGHLQLLKELPGELLLPVPVAMEIQSGPGSDAARQALDGGWGVRVTAGRIPSELVAWGLGPGETAVLGVALERAHCTAVLDDGSARACARAFAIPLIGTLGVVLRARQRGVIPSAGDLLRALRAAGLYLDDETIRSALRRVGEEWK